MPRRNAVCTFFLIAFTTSVCPISQAAAADGGTCVPCRAVSSYGACSSNDLVYCSSTCLRLIPCGAGLHCALLYSVWGYDCLATIGGPCNPNYFLDFTGHACDPAQARCNPATLTCQGYDGGQPVVDAGTPLPDGGTCAACGSIDVLGTCTGNQLSYCAFDCLLQLQCGASRHCAWFDAIWGYDCMAEIGGRCDPALYASGCDPAQATCDDATRTCTTRDGGPAVVDAARSDGATSDAQVVDRTSFDLAMADTKAVDALTPDRSIADQAPPADSACDATMPLADSGLAWDSWSGETGTRDEGPILDASAPDRAVVVVDAGSHADTATPVDGSAIDAMAIDRAALDAMPHHDAANDGDAHPRDTPLLDSGNDDVAMQHGGEVDNAMAPGGCNCNAASDETGCLWLLPLIVAWRRRPD